MNERESLKKDDEVLVKVEDVSKKFCKNLKKSLWYGMSDIAMELTGGRKRNNLRKDEFWAVQDVSFELKRGECLGLIGHNGAGKSTLLKMLNGLIKPDHGRIEIKGKVGALIELGTGFNPILTGRENVYNNAAVLGFSREEVDSKFDDIVEFSELDEFIDTPVQSYSSGMKVRLGFSVAAQLDPDVLIIDEVLAVGDIGFRIKCLNAISKITQRAAIIFVSHSMPQIARISSRAIMLSHGKIQLSTDSISEAVETFYDQFEDEKFTIEGEAIKIENFEFLIKVMSGPESKQTVQYKDGDSIEFSFIAWSNANYNAIKIALTIYDKEMKPLGVTYFQIKDIEAEKKRKVFVKIPEVHFSPGTYNVSLIFYEELDEVGRVHTLSHFRAIEKFQMVGKKNFNHAPLQLKCEWNQTNIPND